MQMLERRSTRPNNSSKTCQVKQASTVSLFIISNSYEPPSHTEQTSSLLHIYPSKTVSHPLLALFHQYHLFCYLRPFTFPFLCCSKRQLLPPTSPPEPLGFIDNTSLTHPHLSQLASQLFWQCKVISKISVKRECTASSTAFVAELELFSSWSTQAVS